MKKNKEKTYLFIDGSNLYAAQFELFGPNQYLDFTRFIEEIERKIPIVFTKIFFYASYSPKSKSPTRKQKLYLKNEALFYKSVKRTRNISFFKGYRSKTSGKEKEVDVRLTADIISFAFLNRYDSAYLLTGDADFLQALLTIKNFKREKQLYLLCLENRVMFQGIFYFKTFVSVINNKPETKRNLRNIRYIMLNQHKLSIEI